MLRKTRTILAAVCLLLITLLFLDFTNTLYPVLGRLAKIQFLPAVLAMDALVIIAIIALTLIFGRIYCSIICPLGVMQDVISRLRFRKWKYSYSREVRWLRYPVLAIFLAMIGLGISLPVSLLAPYSSFGRMAQSLLQPLYIWCNNQLALIAEGMDSTMFYHVEPRMAIGITFYIALTTFVIIFILALRGGRTYCNTICPVGTVLSLMARYSWMKVVIDEGKCRNCRKCENKCKASCIDLKNHKVDYSRCVACGDCLGDCKFGAISYGNDSRNSRNSSDSSISGTPDASRRSFLIGSGLALAGAALAQEKKKVDGGLAIIEDKIAPKRHTKLTPAGSISARNLQQHCTACQLCISKCPNDVLRPSTELDSLMQPYMSYENGYCRTECNACASVCPTGAIKPISLDDKSSIQIGHAVWIRKNCLAASEGVSCDNCARHCPAGAITMVHIDGDEEKPMIPAINEAYCIGCGACEALCPARPFSAIYVEGHEVHKEI